jgi:predicted kinase
LRDQIVAELIQLERLDDDEDIELGKGGGKPKSEPKKEHVAILLTGLPASGKSTVVAKVADHFGAYVVDPDFAKRKFPEYDHTTMGASLVHLESMAVTLGKDYTGINLWQAIVDLGFNLVRPMVGDEREKVDSIRDELIVRGYKVHLTTIDLDREVSSARALQRFLHTDRYVSLSYIFDECANDASLVYYRSRIEALQRRKSEWTSVGIISTSGQDPRFLDSWGDGNPAELFKEES